MLYTIYALSEERDTEAVTGVEPLQKVLIYTLGSNMLHLGVNKVFWMVSSPVTALGNKP